MTDSETRLECRACGKRPLVVARSNGWFSAQCKCRHFYVRGIDRLRDEWRAAEEDAFLEKYSHVENDE